MRVIILTIGQMKNFVHKVKSYITVKPGIANKNGRNLAKNSLL